MLSDVSPPKLLGFAKHFCDVHMQVLQGQTVLQRTAQNEDADGLTRVQHETDERLNYILTLTDNPPPPVSPNDVWWKLNTKKPAPREVASA